ncbi:MAG TPA: hypothetical protein VHX11_09005 [Acidobacteriaceae bacterium]|jgi:hypothetical protein|nr:hypothetical protein [Acidobacteriaceae bacterium]
MKNSLLLLFCFALVGPIFAKDKNWENVTVTREDTDGFYWLRGQDTTYVVRGYLGRSMVTGGANWLHLTVGGNARGYSDGKDFHVVDNQNKERKCPITVTVSNAVGDAALRKEQEKTAEERAQEEQLELQQKALQLERIQAMREVQHIPPPPTVQPVKPLPSAPTTSIHCTTSTLGDTAQTDCRQY